MWKLQQWLYSKFVSFPLPSIASIARVHIADNVVLRTLITLCPSPSTKSMLEGQHFSGVRLWPRGVDLSQFGPSKRCATMRASWGVADTTPFTNPAADFTGQRDLSNKVFAQEMKEQEWTRLHGRCAGDYSPGEKDIGTNWSGRKASLPLTPPLTPWSGPVEYQHNDEDQDHESFQLDDTDTLPSILSATTNTPIPPSRVVLLYVGRISWEKNLHLLLSAYDRLSAHLPKGQIMMPKLVFVGDGPARVELEAICEKAGHDATFMGHRSGEELARCYASADIFAFPSFTEVSMRATCQGCRLSKGLRTSPAARRGDWINEQC